MTGISSGRAACETFWREMGAGPDGQSADAAWRWAGSQNAHGAWEAAAKAAAAAAPNWPRCPDGCGCRLGTDDADAHECGCDGPCALECRENGYPDAPSYRDAAVKSVMDERDHLRDQLAIATTALRDLRNADSPGGFAHDIAHAALDEVGAAAQIKPAGTETEPADDPAARLLALPLPDNDSGAPTVRGYLAELLLKLWSEGESFDGGCPFGNPGWQAEIIGPMVAAGMTGGHLDEDGNLTQVDDEDQADALVLAAIAKLGEATP